MKHLKKLAALLLVGVLALSLLTACGGGGSTSADAQAETAVMAAINQNRPVNSAKLQNSSELRKIANQDLDAAISGKWGQLSSSFTFKSHTDLKNGKFGYTFIAKCDYKKYGPRKTYQNRHQHQQPLYGQMERCRCGSPDG